MAISRVTRAMSSCRGWRREPALSRSGHDRLGRVRQFWDKPLEAELEPIEDGTRTMVYAVVDVPLHADAKVEASRLANVLNASATQVEGQRIWLKFTVARNQCPAACLPTGAQYLKRNIPNDRQRHNT